jgi:hypothetical protein
VDGAPQKRPRVLIAVAPGAVRQVSIALGDAFDCTLVDTVETGIQRLGAGSFDLLVVGYFFDNSQPFRLITQAKATSPRTPILLVRALPLSLGRASEADIRAAYGQLGVAEFLDFQRDVELLGLVEAQELLRRLALHLLHPESRAGPPLGVT